MAEKEKESRLEKLAPIAIPIVIVVVLVVVIVSINVWPHYFGATAEDVANVDLAATPKALAKALPASEARGGDEVRVKFRHTVVGFEEARLYWEHSSDHVSRMKLVPEREKDDGKKGKLEHDTSPKSLEGRLANWAPGIDHGSYRWGPVKLAASDDGELSFSVEASSDDHSVNSMFAKQVEAARQVIVAAAFEIPPTLLAKELADALGSGYPLADVAKIDVTLRKTQALAAIHAQFPASIVEESKVRVPIAFPGLRNVTIRWSSSSQSRPRLEFSTTSALQGILDSLKACVAPKTPWLSIRGNAVDLTSSGELDNATFSGVLVALDACKPAVSTAGGSH